MSKEEDSCKRRRPGGHRRCQPCRWVKFPRHRPPNPRETPWSRRPVSGVSEESVSDVRAVSNLEGTFAWNQDAVTGNEELRHVLYEGVSQYLCGVHGNVAEVAQGASSLNQAVTDGDRIVALRVEGDVRNSFVATIEECPTRHLSRRFWAAPAPAIPLMAERVPTPR